MDTTDTSTTMKVKKGIYKHYKRNYYQVIDIAKHTETQEVLVVYRSMYGNKDLWVRPLDMFNETVKINSGDDNGSTELVELKRFSYCDN